MNKTAIAIWGNADQGKSSSAREIVKRISMDFPKANLDYRIHGPVDIRVIIIIGKTKIGIESQGDPNSRLGESLTLFVKEKCDIIICSTRTKGKTVRLVEDLAKKAHPYDIIWTSNYYSLEKDTDQLNELFAGHIVQLLGRIIDGRIQRLYNILNYRGDPFFDLALINPHF